MKNPAPTTLLLAALSLLLLGGCGSSDSSASAAEEEAFKHPVKGTPPTADQMKPAGPAFVGSASGSIPVGKGGGGGAGAAPPPGALKQPGG